MMTGEGTHSFPNEVCGWVMQESLKHGHQSVFVLTQETEGDLAGSSEGPLKVQLAVRCNPPPSSQDLPLYP